MKKELLIILGIFLFLAVGMHFKEWTTDPIAHLMALPTAGAYGIGAVHPLVFTSILYLIILLIRGIVRIFRKPKSTL